MPKTSSPSIVLAAAKSVRAVCVGVGSGPPTGENFEVRAAKFERRHPTSDPRAPSLTGDLLAKRPKLILKIGQLGKIALEGCFSRNALSLLRRIDVPIVPAMSQTGQPQPGGAKSARQPNRIGSG